MNTPQPGTVTLSPEEVRAAEERESESMTRAMQAAEKQILQHRLIQLSGELARARQEIERLRTESEGGVVPVVEEPAT